MERRASAIRSSSPDSVTRPQMLFKAHGVLVEWVIREMKDINRPEPDVGFFRTEAASSGMFVESISIFSQEEVVLPDEELVATAHLGR